MLHTFVLSFIAFTRYNITVTRWKNDKICNVVHGFCQGAFYFPNVIGVHGKRVNVISFMGISIV